jgi:sensor histidine kinase YesM
MHKPLQDSWIRIANPLLLIVMSLVGQQLLFTGITMDKILGIVRMSIFIIINFEIGRYMVLVARKRYPGLSLTRKRIFASFILCFSITLVAISVSTLISRLQVEKSFSFLDESLINILQAVWITALVVAPYEVLYSYYLSLNSEKEKEELLKATTESKLHALQAQIQPHFLFNSLNTLSELTIKDPYKAEEFVMELSAVYRYLLKSSNQRLTTLKEELDFIQSFMHLLKTRFDERLQFELNIDPTYHVFMIPTLTLQLIVENAVKHNESSYEYPLQISVYIDENNYLVISNNIRKRVISFTSEGFGLSNIVSRYSLLQQPEVIITNNDKEFKVALPLIKPDVHENINN